MVGLLGMAFFLLMDQWYLATSPVLIMAGEQRRGTRHEAQEGDEDADEGNRSQEQETPLIQAQAKGSSGPSEATTSSYRRRESKDKNAPVKRSSVSEIVAAPGPSDASTLLLTKKDQDDTGDEDKTRASVRKGKANVSIREEF